MAVNEDLYSWLLKTQGMPAAEWYRSNPTKPHTSNPHVPPGAAKWFPQASTSGSENIYASVSPDIIEDSVVEPASTSNYFQQFLNSLSSEERADIEGMGDLTEEDKKEIGYGYAARQKLGDLTPAQKTRINDLITYDPNYGEYGGYSTKEDLSFKPSTALYEQYQNWTKNNPVPSDARTMGAVALRYGSSEYPDYTGHTNPESIALVKAYDDAVAARSKAFEDLYKTPLSQLQYKSYSEAPSLEAYRSSLSQLGIDIPLLEGDSSYFVRAATPDDPEVQQFGIYNVGREDYRQTRINEATQKNFELIKQQAEEGIPSSAEYLRDYLAEKQQLGSDAPLMPLGGDAPRAKGPRGEDLGELAQLSLPPGPSGFDRRPDSYHPNNIIPIRSPGSNYRPGEGFNMIDPFKNSPQTQPGLSKRQPVDVRVARAAEKSDEQRERLTQQSEFDLAKEKQLASARAAEAYRRGASMEDPFRAAARVG